MRVAINSLATTKPVARGFKNWNLEELVFVEGGKLENPEKILAAMTRTNNKLNPQMTPGHIFLFSNFHFNLFTCTCTINS